MRHAMSTENTGTSPLYRALLIAQRRLAMAPSGATSAAKMTQGVCDRYPLCECCVKPGMAAAHNPANGQTALLIPASVRAQRDANTQILPPASELPL
jgi:hypothetical protein